MGFPSLARHDGVFLEHQLVLVPLASAVVLGFWRGYTIPSIVRKHCSPDCPRFRPPALRWSAEEFNHWKSQDWLHPLLQ